jgi:hypothetical protein
MSSFNPEPPEAQYAKHWPDMPQVNTEAAARLRAAAPELLAAAVEVVKEWDGLPEGELASRLGGVIDELEAAVRKARGSEVTP